MVKSNKSKWIIGLTGAALSAFVITQVSSTNGQDLGVTAQEKSQISGMSKQEKELVQLDWSNYSINGASVSNPVTEGATSSDRQTRRS
ncbi:hypothetical protein [Bacillus sp. EB600]|uniref:hypothetical protein n=1 Tax=Bacillus sp. EB600 TaxID=2806345 RepID=UPI0021091679|nr:hypothetical protein [Bacillus sp. EB600]MCQ6280356.1 hypothetical protein [Bacillus sp. EB600]